MNINENEFDIQDDFQNNYRSDIVKAPHYKVKIVKKKQSPLQFTFGVISYALFIMLLITGIILLIYVADIKIRGLRGDTTPPLFNAYVVLTGSMEPTIHVNDVVITKKKEAGTLKKDNIITFVSADPRYSGVIVTHRIKQVFLENNVYSYQTKGDNNNVEDATLVAHNNVIGKVIFRIPYLGHIQTFLATSQGWIIVILVPCLIVISYDIMKLFKVVGKKTKRR